MRICLFVRVLRSSRRDVAALLVTVCALGLTVAAPAHAVTPNDPGFASQWGDENTGQPVPAQIIPSQTLGSLVSGTPFADDSASEAWAVTTGSPSVVIGEVDTGVNFGHPDLAANIWSNPGGLTGGCLPGTHGYDVLASTPAETCEPKDQDTNYNGHGTHVAGIMGAVGDNGIGVAGMNWHTTILPVKWLNNAKEEPTFGAQRLAEALKWLLRVREEGVNVRVVNDSATFAGSGKSAEVESEIRALGAHGILFITAAGNEAINENEHRSYPCAFDLPTEICVTATNNRDQLPEWANWGSQTVQLAAPGASIFSTLGREGEAPTYGFLSGTSMAAAQVSGAAALILSAEPTLSATELKADILSHVDKLPSLEGMVESGGRLDVCRALARCVDFPPGPVPPPPPPPPPAPVPPPAIGTLKITPTSFKAARSGPIVASSLRHTGARVRYTDSLPALTEFTVLANRSGIQDAAKQCVAPPRHAPGKPARRCTRWLPLWKFKRGDISGQNTFLFSGHVGRRSLAPGHYRLAAVPMIGVRRGAEALVGFRIVA
jgi:hypothetical protein